MWWGGIFSYAAEPLWERACSRWRCISLRGGWPCRRLREQARSHRDLWWGGIFSYTAEPLWERACSR
ncbi:hypothetical protein C0J56_18740 [Pseudomonas fluorescens]|nr:hypothetical protein C0J56_18740 [Pseudomonas fluorescens]